MYFHKCEFIKNMVQWYKKVNMIHDFMSDKATTGFVSCPLEKRKKERKKRSFTFYFSPWWLGGRAIQGHLFEAQSISRKICNKQHAFLTIVLQQQPGFQMGNHSKQKHVILKTKGACKGGNMKERRGRGQLLLFCTLRGRSLTTLARRGMQVVLKMSTVCRFSLIIVCKGTPSQMSTGGR